MKPLYTSHGLWSWIDLFLNQSTERHRSLGHDWYNIWWPSKSSSNLTIGKEQNSFSGQFKYTVFRKPPDKTDFTRRVSNEKVVSPSLNYNTNDLSLLGRRCSLFVSLTEVRKATSPRDWYWCQTWVGSLETIKWTPSSPALKTQKQNWTSCKWC